ncbi:hypothetical protein D3C76_1651850 [compost metagenome]
MQNFRRALHCRAFCLFRADEMQANPRLQSPGAARTLNHRRLADALCQKTRQASTGIETRYPLLRGIDHQTNTFNG